MALHVFLNELSWENKTDDFYDKPEDFRKEVEKFREIFSLLSKRKISYKQIKLIIDGQAVDSFLEEVIIVLEKDKSLIANLKRLIFDKLNAENWRKNPIPLDPVNYYLLVDLLGGNVVTINENTLAQALEQNIQFPNDLVLVVNFPDSKFTTRTQIDITKDNYTTGTLHHLEKIENVDELQAWLNAYIQLEDFLKDIIRFEKTNIIQQGKAVYKEIDTGYYWYYDNFHRDQSSAEKKILIELEVFDSQGQHLGTADLEGNIDESKRVSGRIIDVN